MWWVKTIHTRRLARQLWGAAAPSTFDEIAALAVADGVVSEQVLFDASLAEIARRNRK